jgi:methylmalonyl-CoA mutase cobalamin-binding domain/chain
MEWKENCVLIANQLDGHDRGTISPYTQRCGYGDLHGLRQTLEMITEAALEDVDIVGLSILSEHMGLVPRIMQSLRESGLQDAFIFRSIILKNMPD